MKLTSDIVETMLGAVLATRDEEIGCSRCYEQVEQFAEMKLEGNSPEQAMPLVKDHLQRCQECREEYNVLLDAIRQIIEGHSR